MGSHVYVDGDHSYEALVEPIFVGVGSVGIVVDHTAGEPVERAAEGVGVVGVLVGPGSASGSASAHTFGSDAGGHVYVEADADERILRRIVRDVKERGRDLDNIVDQYLTTVKPMHYLYVAPTRATADIVINSGMNDVAFDIVQSKIRLLLNEED